MPVNTIISTLRKMCITSAEQKTRATFLAKSAYEIMLPLGMTDTNISNLLQNFDPNLNDEESVEIDFNLQQQLNMFSCLIHADEIVDQWLQTVLNI